jgi:uncharacterized protein (TIGR03067 family)
LLTKLKIATTVLFVMAALGAGVATRTRDGQSQAGEPATAQRTTVLTGKKGLETPRRQSDKEAIQGLWKVVAWEADGWREPPEFSGVRITGDQIIIKSLKDKGGIDAITYRLDETQKPKHIDFVVSPGETKERVVPAGIYHLDHDRLVLCFYIGDKTRSRPTKFETHPGGELWLMVLRREKPIVSPEGGEKATGKEDPPQGERNAPVPTLAKESDPGKNPFLGLQGRVVKSPRTDEWEVELKIPKEHLGQVLSAFDRSRPRAGIYLLVEVLLPSSPT